MNDCLVTGSEATNKTRYEAVPVYKAMRMRSYSPRQTVLTTSFHKTNNVWSSSDNYFLSQVCNWFWCFWQIIYRNASCMHKRQVIQSIWHDGNTKFKLCPHQSSPVVVIPPGAWILAFQLGDVYGTTVRPTAIYTGQNTCLQIGSIANDPQQLTVIPVRVPWLKLYLR